MKPVTGRPAAPSPAAPSPSFTRAYVACGYLLGCRGDDLIAGIAATAASTRLSQQLNESDRSLRARTLAHELTEVAAVLLRARLW